MLGFPSNDFGGQEPGTEAQIKQFCRLTYSVQFPMFEKITNFHKYLLNRNGELIASYGSSVEPDDPRLFAAIEQQLAK